MTIAFFPGRFQPPHLGHVLTLMRIYPQYDRIVVGISEMTYGGRKKPVLSIRVVKEILENVFQYLPKFEVILSGESVITRETFDDLPKFDIIVNGNPITIHRLERIGVKCKFEPRSEGIGWRGTELREVLNWL